MDIITLRQWDAGFGPVAALIHQEWSDFERWSSREVIAERLRKRNAPGNDEITLVALVDGMPVATASIIKYELRDDMARQYWLGEVLTAQAHRGKGIAGKLIRALLETARKEGYPELWLYTPDQQALYAYLGWQSIEEKYVSGEWVSVMALPLSPSALS